MKSNQVPRILLLIVCAIFAACTAKVSSGADADTTADANDKDLSNTAVFAHTRSTLYAVDPSNFALSPIGQLTGLENSITDIAINKQGEMVGVTRNAVYDIDPQTADLQLITDIGDDAFMTALTFVPDPIDSDKEILIGVDKDGSVYRINTLTGVVDEVGNYQNGIGSSGDIVFVEGLGIVATVINAPGMSTVALATIDPLTFAATPIGETGFDCVYGIGFWSDSVFGFTCHGDFVLIDPINGNATLQDKSSAEWFGAGVTTDAPVNLE